MISGNFDKNRKGGVPICIFSPTEDVASKVPYHYYWAFRQRNLRVQEPADPSGVLKACEMFVFSSPIVPSSAWEENPRLFTDSHGRSPWKCFPWTPAHGTFPWGFPWTAFSWRSPMGNEFPWEISMGDHTILQAPMNNKVHLKGTLLLRLSRSFTKFL